MEIPGDVLQQLTPLLINLLSPDNDVRSAAETELNEQWVKQQRDLLLVGLSHFIAQNNEAQLRSHCSVLLRRLAFKSYTAPTDPDARLWDMVQENTRSQVKQLLLIALANESDQGTRHKVADTIAEVARSDLEGNVKWEALLKALFECSQAPSAAHRESAFRIFASVPELISDQHTDTLKTVFLGSLTDAESQAVRLEAMKAAAAYIVKAEADTQKALGALMPHMLETLGPVISSRDDQVLVDGLVVLIELADAAPRLFKPVLPNLLSAMVSIAKDKSFEDRTRQTALELLLTLAEAAQGMVRKVPNFAQEVIPVAMEMVTDMEDDESWYTTDDLDEDDNEENYVMGESTLDRIARALGGKIVVPVAFQYIPQMLQSNEWQQRRASLMAISSIGEGCVKVMKPELGNIIQMVLPYFKDPHPRVRYAACNAIGQMSTDFAPTLQKGYHQPIITAILPVMDDSSQPRVQAHAAAAMVNFCEEADKATLDPYLDAIFERLLILLRTPKTYVQEQAITTIATVADCAEDKFVKYHNVIVPLLLDILRQATDKQYRLLRGRAIECASLIGLAIGKEGFAPYTQDFIHILAEIQQSVTEADDVQTTYLLAAWARMCKMMGQDFLPYLPNIMPPLLQSARVTPEFTFVDPEEEDVEANYSAEDGWDFVAINGQHIGIKTSVLEEKHTAIEMLVSYARDLGAGFLPYVASVLEIALPLLKFYFHDGVRHAAAALLPLLLKDAKDANVPSEELASMWHTIYEKVIKILANEDDISFLAQLYATFYESIEVLGENCLQAEQVESFTAASETHLKMFLEQLTTREAEKQSGEYEGDEEEQMVDEEATEEDALGELAHAIQSIFKTHHGAFLPYFDRLLPSIVPFLSHPSAAARQFAVCVFDDLVEYMGPASYNYANHFLQAMLSALSDPSPEVRQAAAYGLGVCGQFGGAQYADVCAAALEPLFGIINMANAREDESLVYVTENAIAAVAKICKFNSSKFAPDAVISAWFNTLPIVNDDQEAPFVYSYLLELLEAHHPSILGPNNANIPSLVKVFTDVLAADILPAELTGQVVNNLKVILAGVDDGTRTQLWNSIAPETRAVLQEKGYV
ncbi:armadillo-type protein [Fennellomyces sp. T-0311]|nr:armadillo-type protein [Fennellomyces sp. T-0311]